MSFVVTFRNERGSTQRQRIDLVLMFQAVEHKITHTDYRMLEALLLSRFIHVYWMFYSSIIERS